MTIDVERIRPRLQAALGDALQLGDLLGTGGFAAVFRAHDPFLQRDVAIKVLDPALGVSDDLEAQFLREARIVAAVEHPHIVALYDAESKDGLLFLVMRLLPGQSLADRLRSHEALNPAEALRLASQVASALAAAHERGVVHRDIKPDNILLDASGNATVTDFGISRVTSRPSADEKGITVGTPHYMSPEQALGEELDGRSDVYALGVVLFEMLAGRLPFEGRNTTELLAKVIASPAPSVTEFAPETPRALASLVARLLSKSRDQRPTAAELVTLLADAQTPDALLSPRAARRRKWRRRLLFAGVGIGTAVLVLFFVFRGLISVATFLFSDPGEEPVLSARGNAIPESLLADARADGTIGPTDTVLYAFIPGGRTASDALFLLKNNTLIRRTPTGVRRFALDHGVFNMRKATDRRTNRTSAVLLLQAKGSPRVDTVYADLHGRDMLALISAAQALIAGKRDTTTKQR